MNNITNNIANNKKSINITGLNKINDPFYRYKMESVEISKQGVKFAFVNIDSVCSSISREPNELISFLKKYFGTSFEYKNGIALTAKKDLTKDDLQNAIFKYIEDNVLCKKCKNPETVYVKEKKKILLSCKACSHKEII